MVAQLPPWLCVETHLPSVGKWGCCVVRCFLEQMPKQRYFETFDNYSSTSQSQLKHPKIREVSPPAVRETGVSTGSGMGQSPPEAFAGCAQGFLPEAGGFPRMSPVQWQELGVKKCLPRINLITRPRHKPCLNKSPTGVTRRGTAVLRHLKACGVSVLVLTQLR